MIEVDDKLLAISINEMAATDAGKIVFAMLKDACHWDATLVSTENPQTTQFYAAQRGIYGALRQLIKTEHLKQIEFNYKRKPHDNGTRTTSRKSINTRSKSSTSPGTK